MKVILYHPNYEKFKAKLKDYNFAYENNYENLKANISNYDGLIAFGLNKDIDLSNLKWIQSLGAGVDWITNNKSVSNNTIITRVTEGLEIKLFEYVLTRILFYYQNVLTHYLNQQQASWQFLTSTSLKDKKVLIIGTGQIGAYIGKKLSDLKMEVYGVNSTGYDIEGFKKCYTFKDLKKEMFFDCVVNVLPSTKETINILNENFFNNIKQDLFINVGRGDALDVDVLVDKLNKKEIKMAFLDVFKEEPLKKSSPLWQVNNLHITPHIAGLTKLEQLITTIIKNYHDVINNKEIASKVNLEKGY